MKCTGISLDITDRKQMEEGFQKIFRVAPVMMSLTTLDEGVYLDVNESFIRTSGFSRDELVGRTYAEVGWMSKEARKQLLSRLREYGRFRSFPITVHTREGREVHCLYSGEAVQWGHREALLSIALDVTDSYQAQRELQASAEALRESESRYRELFERSPVAMWEEDLSQLATRFAEFRQEGIVDLRTHMEAHPEVMLDLARRVRVLAVNQASLKLMGATGHDEFVRDLGRYFDESAWALFRDQIARLYAGEEQFEAETTHRDIKGNALQVHLQLSVLRGQAGDLSRVLVSFSDLTARKAADEKRRELEREVEHLQRLESLGQTRQRRLARHQQCLGRDHGHRLDPGRQPRPCRGQRCRHAGPGLPPRTGPGQESARFSAARSCARRSNWI